MSLTNSSLNSSIDAPLKALSPPPHLCAMPPSYLNSSFLEKFVYPLKLHLFLVTLARRAYNKLPPLQLLKDASFTLRACVMYTPPILACSVSLKAATIPYCSMCDTKSSQDSSMMHPWKLQRLLPTFVPCVQQTPPFWT